MPVTILVADDSATMRSVLQNTFAGEDVRLTTVDSGDAAIARASEIRPDIVIADASMDGADGYEVAAAIKQSLGIPVLLLASQHTPYDDARGRASGVDDHIVKPFDTTQMIDRVMRLATGGARPAAAAAPAAARPVAAPVAPAAVRPVAPAAAPAAAPKAPVRSTVAFGAPAAPRPPVPAAAPVAAPVRAAPVAAPVAQARPVPAAPPVAAARPAAAPVAARVEAASAAMSQKLDGLGLSPEQADAVLKLSREVIERVVWEVVPDLAETIIREELRRLTSE